MGGGVGGERVLVVIGFMDKDVKEVGGGDEKQIIGKHIYACIYTYIHKDTHAYTHIKVINKTYIHICTYARVCIYIITRTTYAKEHIHTHLYVAQKHIHLYMQNIYNI